MLVLYPDYLVEKTNKQPNNKQHQQNAVWEQDNFVLIIDLQLPLGVHGCNLNCITFTKDLWQVFNSLGIISYDLDHYKPSLAA